MHLPHEPARARLPLEGSSGSLKKSPRVQPVSAAQSGGARSSRKPQACDFPAVCDEAGGSLFFIVILTDSAFTDSTN